MLGPCSNHYICGPTVHISKFELILKDNVGRRQGYAVVRESVLLYALQIDMGQEANLEKYLQLILFVLIAFL